MLDTKVQTPISNDVLTKARERAEDLGFNSVNDVIRIMMKLFSEGKIGFDVSFYADASSIPFVGRDEQKELERRIRRSRKKGDSKIVKTKTVSL